MHARRAKHACDPSAAAHASACLSHAHSAFCMATHSHACMPVKGHPCLTISMSRRSLTSYNHAERCFFAHATRCLAASRDSSALHARYRHATWTSRGSSRQKLLHRYTRLKYMMAVAATLRCKESIQELRVRTQTSASNGGENRCVGAQHPPPLLKPQTRLHACSPLPQFAVLGQFRDACT